jgi:hypothetical protein
VSFKKVGKYYFYAICNYYITCGCIVQVGLDPGVGMYIGVLYGPRFYVLSLKIQSLPTRADKIIVLNDMKYILLAFDNYLNV